MGGSRFEIPLAGLPALESQFWETPVGRALQANLDAPSMRLSQGSGWYRAGANLDHAQDRCESRAMKNQTKSPAHGRGNSYADFRMLARLSLAELR
jgi:hypothetical protein